jgi:TolA-binding protein
MDLTWKKIALIAGFFVSLVALPLILLSNPMMDFYQGKIDKNPNSGFSKWLQLNMGNICYKTMRPERAAIYYYNYLERYKDDVQRPWVMLRYGMSLEEANRNAEALQVYQQVVNDYPDREEAKDAIQGQNRIRYWKPK